MFTTCIILYYIMSMNETTIMINTESIINTTRLFLTGLNPTKSLVKQSKLRPPATVTLYCGHDGCFS